MLGLSVNSYEDSSMLETRWEETTEGDQADFSIIST